MRLLFHSFLERVGGGWGGGVCLKLDVQGQGSGNILDIHEQGGGGF